MKTCATLPVCGLSCCTPGAVVVLRGRDFRINVCGQCIGQNERDFFLSEYPVKMGRSARVHSHGVVDQESNEGAVRISSVLLKLIFDAIEASAQQL